MRGHRSLTIHLASPRIFLVTLWSEKRPEGKPEERPEEKPYER
jgi:hypothetical protein